MEEELLPLDDTYEKRREPDSLDAGDQLLSAAEFVEQVIEDGHTVYGDQFDSIDEDLDFCLDLDHYETGRSRTRDRRRIEPKTLLLANLVRHKAGKLAVEETHLDCRPVDGLGDSESAQWAKFAIEHEIHNPLKRYRARRRTMILGGLAARLWGMAVDYDSHSKQLYFRNVDPTKFGIAPGWTDMHDPTCPYIWEEQTWRVQDVWKMDGVPGWKNVLEVKGTSDGSSVSSQSPRQSGRNTDARGRTTLSANSEDRVGSSAQKVVRLGFVLLRNDGTQASRPKLLPLPEGEQYWKCEACDSPVETDVMGTPNLDAAEGDVAPSCPECGGPLTWEDHVEEEERYDVYPNGRMIISALDEAKCVYDGPWRFAMRSYGYWFFRAYEHPRRWIGHSDTSYNWSLQVLDDALLRFGFEQMIRNQDIVMTPLGGLLNSKGMPFRFTDEAGQIAYFSDPMAAKLTQHFQGSGLPPAWGLLKQSVENTFHANAGTSDVAVAPTQSRDIPVGTIDQMVAQGEVPNEMHKEQLREDEGIFLGCVYDMIIGGAWDAQKWVRMIGPNGVMVMEQLTGTAMPQMDVFVSATPRLFNLRAEDFKLFMEWLQLGQTDPAAQMVAGKLLNVSPLLVQEYRTYQQMLTATPTTKEGPGPEAEGDAEEGESDDLPPAIAERMGMNGGTGGRP